MIDEVEIKVWDPSWWGHKPLHFIYVTYPRIDLGPNPEHGTTLTRSRVAVSDPVRVCGSNAVDER